MELAGDDLALVEPYVAFHLHASKHYGAIAAALLAAQEREAELRAEVEALREYKAMYLGLCK